MPASPMELTVQPPTYVCKTCQTEAAAVPTTIKRQNDGTYRVTEFIAPSGWVTTKKLLTHVASEFRCPDCE